MSGGVTCIVPTHGRSRYLSEALAAVARQVLLPEQVVVVSDVPDEAAEQVCRQATSELGLRITYVSTAGETAGASASRNRGAAEAVSQYVAFLDDDDTWEDTYLQRAVSALESSDRDMTVTWIQLFRQDMTTPGPAVRAGLLAKDVVAVNPGVTGSNIVMTKSAFDAIGGFDDSLMMKNDTDFFYRFLKSDFAYSVIDRRLVNQRKHSSGQLTGHSSARADHTQAYLAKHGADMSRRDRRHIRFVISRIRRNSSRTRRERLIYTASALRYYSLRQFRIDRHNRSNADYYAVPAMDRTSG